MLQRDCALGVITFKRLDWEDYRARIIDISVLGICIETKQQVEPGLVWFKERIGGHRSGVLKWTRAHGDGFRSGIEFVLLPRPTEQYLQEQLEKPQRHGPLKDPDRIVASLIETVKQHRNSAS